MGRHTLRQNYSRKFFSFTGYCKVVPGVSLEKQKESRKKLLFSTEQLARLSKEQAISPKLASVYEKELEESLRDRLEM